MDETVKTSLPIFMLSPAANCVVKEVPVPVTVAEFCVTETVPVSAEERLPLTCRSADGALFPTPTLPVLVLMMLLPLVVHCALASAGQNNASASNRKAAARCVGLPLVLSLIVFMFLSSVV